MHKYRLVAKKGEGTFSEVLKAQCIKNGKYVAIKCMKNHFDSLDQVNNLREIQALRRLSPHAHIIKLLEVLYDQPTGRLALVFELMDMNIYELIRGRRHYVAEDRVKHYMYQLMKAMDHMHRNGIFHRDIKPENILIMDDCLKLADFGSCRGIYSKQPYTEYISTRWYRAPECLLTDGYYNYKMDMWGVGCVFFEIMSLFPLFPGTNELDQIQKIHNILGTPPPELLAKMKKRSAHMDFNFPPKEGTGVAKLIPHVPPDCVDLICKLLAYNPDDRLSARQALRHPYFRELREAEKRQKAMMNPEAPLSLSAQPSAASQGHTQCFSNQGNTSNGGGHNSGTMPVVEELKSARHQHTGSASASDHHMMGANSMNANAGSMMMVSSSPPESSRMADAAQASLPSISKPSVHQGNAYLTQHSQHAAHAMHGSSMHQAANHDASLYRMVQAANNATQEDEGPLEISNSYRLHGGLHAENSMDTLSQIHGEGGLPPIGNAVANKQGQRRAGYYDVQHNIKAGYTQAKNAHSKRQVQPQHKFNTSNKPGMPAGVIGHATVAGHKVGPVQQSDQSATSQYKYKTGQSNKSMSKYVSPYSIRQLVGVGKE